jgi:hypothetical protein
MFLYHYFCHRVHSTGLAWISVVQSPFQHFVILCSDDNAMSLPMSCSCLHRGQGLWPAKRTRFRASRGSDHREISNVNALRMSRDVSHTFHHPSAQRTSPSSALHLEPNIHSKSRPYNSHPTAPSAVFPISLGLHN